MKNLPLTWGMRIAEAKKIIPKDNPMRKGSVKVSVTMANDHGDKTEFLDFEGRLGELRTENSLLLKNGKLNSIITKILDITKDNVMISYGSIKQALVEQFGSPEPDPKDDEEGDIISYKHHWVNLQKNVDVRLFIRENKDGTVRSDLYINPLKQP